MSEKKPGGYFNQFFKDQPDNRARLEQRKKNDNLVQQFGSALTHNLFRQERRLAALVRTGDRAALEEAHRNAQDQKKAAEEVIKKLSDPEIIHDQQRAADRELDSELWEMSLDYLAENEYKGALERLQKKDGWKISYLDDRGNLTPISAPEDTKILVRITERTCKKAQGRCAMGTSIDFQIVPENEAQTIDQFLRFTDDEKGQMGFSPYSTSQSDKPGEEIINYHRYSLIDTIDSSTSDPILQEGLHKQRKELCIRMLENGVPWRIYRIGADGIAEILSETDVPAFESQKDVPVLIQRDVSTYEYSNNPRNRVISTQVAYIPIELLQQLGEVVKSNNVLAKKEEAAIEVHNRRIRDGAVPGPSLKLKNYELRPLDSRANAEQAIEEIISQALKEEEQLLREEKIVVT